MAVRDPDFARRLVDGLRTGLLAVDGAGRVAALSPEAARVLGLPAPATCLGRPAAELLAAHPRVWSVLREALVGHEPPSRAELCLGGQGGEIGFTLVALRDADGTPDGAAMWFRDLTPFERTSSQERLRDRLAALGQMAAGLAHELRNPLASLELLTGLLERQLAGDAEKAELVAELHGEIRALAATVDASLSFVRAREPSAAEVDVPALFEEALRRAGRRRAMPGRVERSLEAGLVVRADPEQLRTALENLIDNALEAMAGHRRPGGHALYLEACSEAEGARLAVADTGRGVPAELRERIFYPFFTTRAEGSGVGLAEVQKLVVAHGGSVAVEDAPGGGARFVIHLPRGGP